MARGPAGRTVDEEAADEFADVEDEDVEDEDDEEELEGAGDGDPFATLENRLTKTVSRRISNYIQNQEKRLAKYRERQHSWRQRRLDEFALKNIGTAQIQNPEAVAQSLERQVEQVQSRLQQLLDMQTKLQQVTAGEEVGANA